MKEYKVELKKTSFIFITLKAKDLQEAEERALNNAEGTKGSYWISKKNYGDPNKYEVNKIEELLNTEI
jgi:hypothetical protein